MIVVVRVRRANPAYPTVWEGLTEDGRHVVARYRWAFLSVELGPVGGEVLDAYFGERVFEAEHGAGEAGELSYDELRALTHRRIVWPPREDDAA